MIHMTLTPAQQATLKAFIETDPTLNAFPNNEDGADSIANELNKVATPVFIVWKTSVTKGEIGITFDGGELSNLTTAESNRLQTFAQWSNETINPSDADVRFLFNDVFSGAGGNVTRPALDALWRRNALLIEKVLISNEGAGTTQDPAKLDFEGEISRRDVFEARNS